MRSRFIHFFISAIIFTANLYSYELIEEKVTVSPGCIGGVTYCISEVGFLSPMADVISSHFGTEEAKSEFLSSMTNVMASHFTTEIEESKFLSSVTNIMTSDLETKGIVIDKNIIGFFVTLGYKLGCSSSVSARAYSTSGMLNNNVELSSEHGFYLCNDTNETCEFRVQLKLSTHDYHSTERSESFYLRPNETKRSSIGLCFYKSYSEPGEYTITASTEISGASTSSTRDTARVKIR